MTPDLLPAFPLCLIYLDRYLQLFWVLINSPFIHPLAHFSWPRPSPLDFCSWQEPLCYPTHWLAFPSSSLHLLVVFNTVDIFALKSFLCWHQTYHTFLLFFYHITNFHLCLYYRCPSYILLLKFGDSLWLYPGVLFSYTSSLSLHS